jgi:hypothetical protein
MSQIVLLDQMDPINILPDNKKSKSSPPTRQADKALWKYSPAALERHFANLNAGKYPLPGLTPEIVLQVKDGKDRML